MTVAILAFGAIAFFVVSVIFATHIGKGPDYSTQDDLIGVMTFICLFLSILFAAGSIGAMIGAVL